VGGHAFIFFEWGAAAHPHFIRTSTAEAIDSQRGPKMAEPTIWSRRLRPLVGLLIVSALVSSCTSSYLGRWFGWRASDIDDWRRFPSRPIAAAEEPFRFISHLPMADLTIPDPRKNGGRSIALSRLAEQTRTTALLVIRNDTLLFEGYFHGHARDSVSTSFSTAKSITSLLVGIAVDERLIGSVDDPVTKYVPELATRDARFARVTIRHLLNMTSGIRFRDHDLPWGDKPRAYYHPHLRHVLLRELQIAEAPGQRWLYNTYNPQLLGLVLERVSGTTISRFAESRLWSRIGTEYDASWSVDGAVEPLEKMESGVNARPVDFAKIGRLMFHRGDWNGTRVVSSSWIDESTGIAPGCELAAFAPRSVCYQHAWWLYPETDHQRPAIGATGHLGQFIFVFPKEHLVMVRFGERDGGVSWPAVFQAVAKVVAP